MKWVWIRAFIAVSAVAFIFFDLGQRKAAKECNRDQTGVHLVSDAVK